MTVIINSFNNLAKEKLLISILALIFEKDVENIAIINVNTYCLACQLKGVQIFAFLIKNLKF